MHSGPWFRVRTDRALRPDGSPGRYDWVESPGSVSVVAVDATDHVVVSKQWIYTFGDKQWRLPGGGMDPVDSDPAAAARRELDEEAGLIAGRVEPLGRIHCADSWSNHVEHLFLATDLTAGRQRLDAGEAGLTLQRLPFAEAVDLARTGEIPHAGSAHALLLAALSRSKI